MKIEWEVDDIRPGRIVGKPKREERWMIGYLVELSGNVYIVVSHNADGMVACRGTKQQLAAHLNAAEELPVELL